MISDKKAMRDENKLFSAFCPILDREYSVRHLPAKYEHFRWKCPECGRKVYFKEDLGYFQHVGVPRCGREAESIEHKVMKAYWYLMIPKFNPVKKKAVEYRIDGHEIDVYFEFEDGKKVAVECQNSVMSVGKLRRRTKDYTIHDIFTLWVFNGFGSFVGDNKNPQNQEGVAVRKAELGAQRIYKGRIYYMNVKGKKIIDPPFSLHIASMLEHKTSDYNPVGYDKFSKRKYSVTVGKIPSYRLVFDESKTYKIARFMDRNVSSLCTQAIRQFITEYCHKQVCKKIRKGIVKIPINTILDALAPWFGYNLVYLKIKKATHIKRIKIKQKFDHNYNLNEFIVIRVADYFKKD